MEPGAITETLQEIDTLRRETRRALQSFWFPLVLFGALTLAGAPLCRLADGRALGLFWAVAGPAGGVAVAVHYTRREQRLTGSILLASGLVFRRAETAPAS